jgi:hypothetical protein
MKLTTILAALALAGCAYSSGYSDRTDYLSGMNTAPNVYIAPAPVYVTPPAAPVFIPRPGTTPNVYNPGSTPNVYYRGR